MTTTRLAVFLSGTGRTLVNLARAIDSGALPAEIGLVVASRDCQGVERAMNLGIPVRVIEGDIDVAPLESMLESNQIEWVALAGYLRKLPIPARWAGRIVNIHPALLPLFGGPGMYGDRVHEAVLDSGVTETGCTVHLCDDRYDTGPIVLQRTCPVLDGDTPQALADRVFDLETEAYPEALRMLIRVGSNDAAGAQGRGAIGPTIDERPERP
jgi:folate-dependent phosphoribosylglycinamide formyltransferase PurN